MQPSNRFMYGWACLFYTGVIAAQTPQPIGEIHSLSHTDGSSDPKGFVEIDGEVLFTTDQPAALWRTDGTSSGTRALATFASTGEFRLALNHDQRFFTLIRSDYPGWTLVVSDGTTEGTYQIPDFPLVGLRTNLPRLSPFAQIGGVYYFLGRDGDTLWRSELDTEAAEIVTTFENPLGYETYYSVPVAWNGQIFVLRGHHETGITLWRYSPASGQLTDVGFVANVDDSISVTGLGDSAALTASEAGLFFFTEYWTAAGPAFNAHRDLWFSNGSPTGLTDLAVFSVTGFGQPAHGLMPFSDGVVFTAFEPDSGYELWASSGTTEGTRRLTDLAPGGADAHPQGFVELSDQLLFFATAAEEVALWTMSTEFEAPQPVIQVRPNDFYQPRYPSEWFFAEPSHGEIWFFGQDPLAGDSRGLWKSDGTEAGTFLVDATSWGTLPAATSLGVFYASLSAFGREPGISRDGLGSVLLNINETPRELPASVPQAEVFDDRLYFLAADKHGLETLKRSDGSEETTMDLAIVGAHQVSTNPSAIHEAQITALGNQIIWIDRDDVLGLRVVTVDTGSLETLLQIENRFADVRILGVGDSLAFLSVRLENQWSIYRCDGDQDGTYAVLNFSLDADGSLLHPIMDGDRLFFVAGRYGIYDLYLCGGDEEASGRVARLMDESSEFSSPRQLTIINRHALIHTVYQSDPFVPNPVHRERLWQSDGTPEGTLLVRESDRPMAWLGQNDSWLYFTVFPGQLWRTDGSEMPPELVSIDPIFSQITPWDSHPGSALFTAVVDGRRAIVSTDFETTEIWFEFPGPASDWPLQYVAKISEQVFFTHDQRLWVATRDQGAMLLSEFISVGSNGSTPPHGVLQAVFDGKLVFAAESQRGMELWKTDGSALGTRALQHDGTFFSVPTMIEAGVNHLFFATQQNTVQSIWSTCKSPQIQLAGVERLAVGEAGEVSLVELPLAATVQWELDQGTVIAHTDQSVSFRAEGNNDVVVSARVEIPGGCVSETQRRVRVFDVVESSAWIGHVTRVGHGFRTQILIHNDGKTAASATLQPYGMEGQPFPPVSVEVPLGGYVVRSTNELFGADPISHFGVDAPAEVTVTASYTSTRTTGVHAEVHAGLSGKMRWRFYAGDWTRVFDGLALLNAGHEAAQVYVRSLSGDGQVLGEADLLPVAPKSKTLTVCADVLPNIPGSLIEVVSDRPLQSVLLRGDLENAEALWVIIPF